MLFVNRILSHLDLDIDYVIYTIDNVINEIIIIEMLWYLKNIEGQTYINNMRAFKFDIDMNNYSRAIKIWSHTTSQ